MSKPERALEGALLDERSSFSLLEFCQLCGVDSELLAEMVEEGVVEPGGEASSEWRFSGLAVVRVQKALRLRRDLRINWPGAALALDLLEELETLRRRTK